jgi:hypothetical protein
MPAGLRPVASLNLIPSIALVPKTICPLAVQRARRTKKRPVQRARRTKKRPFKFGPSMSPRGIEVYCLSIPLLSGSCEGSPGTPPVGVERSTPPRANRGARWQGCAQLACS